MYTDVLRIQQPHHLPTSVHQQRYNGPYDTFPDLPSQRMAHTKNQSRTRNASFRQRLQQPQQYAAHPRPSTLTFQSSTKGFCTSDADDAEHMLRRKTPNGTLAAGYDGRSTGLAARPHVAKHILVSASDNVEGASYPEASVAEQLLVPPLGQTYSTQALHEQPHQYHGSTVHPLYGSNQFMSRDRNIATTLEKKPMPYYGAGVDSVLNQGLTLQQSHVYGNVHEVPTVLQPMWPPCLGSTSMNHTGPYGPYWFDGAFEPYRPAPVRDPRYDHQSPGSATNLGFFPGPGIAQDQDGSHSRPANQHLYPGKLSINHQPDRRYAKTSPFQQRIHPASNERRTSEWPYQTQALRHEEIPVHCNHGRFGNDFEGFELTHAPSGAVQDVVHRNGNAQFKEKVLVWAHRTYVSLLASIHRSRRNGSLGNLREERLCQSSIYPKPPGQPFMHSSSGLDLESQCEPCNTVQPPNVHKLSTLNIPKSLPAGNLSDHQYRDFRNRRSPPTWQIRKQPSPFAQFAQHQGHRFRDILGGPNALLSQYEAPSPAAAALSALEMLSRLCHESGWQWTDGMLLGGCLAYGLGDHTRAMKWYSKVLACDPRQVVLTICFRGR